MKMDTWFRMWQSQAAFTKAGKRLSSFLTTVRPVATFCTMAVDVAASPLKIPFLVLVEGFARSTEVQC